MPWFNRFSKMFELNRFITVLIPAYKMKSFDISENKQFRLLISDMLHFFKVSVSLSKLFKVTQQPLSSV